MPRGKPNVSQASYISLLNKDKKNIHKWNQNVAFSLKQKRHRQQTDEGDDEDSVNLMCFLVFQTAPMTRLWFVKKAKLIFHSSVW